MGKKSGGGSSFQEIKDRLQNVGSKLSSSELDKIKEKTGVSGGIRAIARKTRNFYPWKWTQRKSRGSWLWIFRSARDVSR
jgi:hypothetical protein